MEIEYKWDFPTGDVERLLRDGLLAAVASFEGSTAMYATYFDTDDGMLGRERVGLRVRREGERAVCCMKTPAPDAGGAKTRHEFEVAAADVHEGLRLLPDAGAPRELCASLAQRELAVLCETVFTRRAYAVAADGFAAELAFDEGELRRQGRHAALRELELEFADGSEAAFHAFAEQLEQRFGLRRQPRSKLARAASL